MTRSAPWMGPLALCTLVACHGDAPTTASDSHASTEIATGFHLIDEDASYFDVAASETHAFVVDGTLGENELDVVSLDTLEVVDRWTAIDDLPPVPASEQDDEHRSDLELAGVQVLEDGQVVVFGRRDDAYPVDIVDDFLGQGSRWQFSFVVQGLSSDGSTAEWSLGLDLRGAVAPSSALVQRESMNAHVTGDTIAITFSHISQPDLVFTIPRPDGHEMYQLVERDGVDLPVAPITMLGHVETPRDIVALEDGAFLVTGSEGLFRVTESGADNLAPGLSFDEGYYLTELRVVDDLAIVADHSFGLQILSARSGALVDSVELDHDERGLEVTDGQVIVGSETGMTVLDIAWEAPIDGGSDDDEPDDDGGVPDEPEEDCGWSWTFWGPVWTCS